MTRTNLCVSGMYVALVRVLPSPSCCRDGSFQGLLSFAAAWAQMQDPPSLPPVHHHTPTALLTVFQARNLHFGGNRSTVGCMRAAYADLIHMAFRSVVGDSPDVKVSYDHRVDVDEVSAAMGSRRATSMVAVQVCRISVGRSGGKRLRRN